MTVDKEIYSRRYRSAKRAFAHRLRLRTTPTEKRLWIWLRGRRLRGYKFLRQAAIGLYVADFLCSERRLIVEVDGKIHDLQKEYDRERDAYLADLGYRVLRISADDVAGNISKVLGKIISELDGPHP